MFTNILYTLGLLSNRHQLLQYEYASVLHYMKYTTSISWGTASGYYNNSFRPWMSTFRPSKVKLSTLFRFNVLSTD